MLETLRAWLNGKREYFTGVVLFAQLSDNTALVTLFKKGKTEYTTKRLQQELLNIFHQLKEVVTDSNKIVADGNKTAPQGNKSARHSNPVSHPNSPSQNPDLYDACKTAADKKYKEAMNQRAVLFNLAQVNDYSDINLPDRIESRAKLSLDVIRLYNEASQLYDKAAYVKLHGRLPYTDENQDENEYDHLPDHLVKQTLDNLRKNYNKMKVREQTPERIALLQRHLKNITKLEGRWHLLKPL